MGSKLLPEVPRSDVNNVPIQIWTPDPAKTLAVSLAAGAGAAVAVTGWKGLAVFNPSAAVRFHILSLVSNFRGILVATNDGAIDDTFIYAGRLYRCKAAFTNIAAGNLPGSGSWATYFDAAYEYSEITADIYKGLYPTVLQVVIVNPSAGTVTFTREGM